jgi:hypothetical protein
MKRIHDPHYLLSFLDGYNELEKVQYVPFLSSCVLAKCVVYPVYVKEKKEYQFSSKTEASKRFSVFCALIEMT